MRLDTKHSRNLVGKHNKYTYGRVVLCRRNNANILQRACTDRERSDPSLLNELQVCIDLIRMVGKNM